MKAVIELRVRDFDNTVVESIKSMFTGKEDATLTISVEDVDSSYLEILRRSKNDLDNNRNLITFTMEELEAYGNSKKTMRKITFTPDGFKDYNRLLADDFSYMQKVQLLIRDIQENLFKGLGKPEPLKADFSGFWSRRINHEHRLVYKITNEAIEIIKCYGHYND